MENFKKFYTRAIQILSGVFFNGLLIITVIAMISFVGNVVRGQEPTVFGYKPIYIMTGSMETNIPDKTIDKGSVIITQRIDPRVKGEVQVGDVVTYSQIDYKEDSSGNIVGQEVNITHRVTHVDEDKGTFRAKGDANMKGDAFWKDGEMVEDLPIESIKYKVVKRMNWVANIGRLTQKPKVMILYGISLVSFIVLVKIINSSFYDPQYEMKIFGGGESEIKYEYTEAELQELLDDKIEEMIAEGLLARSNDIVHDKDEA